MSIVDHDVNGAALMAAYNFKSKYAKYNKEAGRRESWEESVDRMMNMHLKKYGDRLQDADLTEVENTRQMIKDKRLLGSQRALQFGGDGVLRHEMRIYNCTVSYCDRPRFFAECFYMLLCGCGTGFSVQRHHVDCLPNLISLDTLSSSMGQPHYIDDTIEGWAEALNQLMEFFFGIRESFPVFDYSLIRKRGEALSTGGKAPGPEPLKRALELIEKLLRESVARSNRIRPIDCYDIIMHASDAVLSGGVRRSATIALFSPDDEEMMNAKTGNWFLTNPQRGRSNNSAVLLKSEDNLELFKSLMKRTREFGEPGFIFVDSTEYIFNPCVKGDSLIQLGDGLGLAEDLASYGKLDLTLHGKTFQTSDLGFIQTGVQKVLRFTTKAGRVLEVTPNHMIGMSDANWCPAELIEVGDEIAISCNKDMHLDLDKEIDDIWRKKGYLIGAFLGDGNISGNSIELKFWGEDKDLYRSKVYDILGELGWLHHSHKEVSTSNSQYSCIRSRELYDFAYRVGALSSEEGKILGSKRTFTGRYSYLQGLLRGLFDADGTVGTSQQKGRYVRLTSVSVDLLRNAQTALTAFGINSKIYYNRYPEGYRPLPDGNGGTALYYCKATHELHISSENLFRFFNVIGFTNITKQESLSEVVSSYKRRPNVDHFIDEIISIEEGGLHSVYDCEVLGVNAFSAQGIVVHNCVEISMCPTLITYKNQVVKEYSLDLLDFKKRSEWESLGYKFESGWQTCVSGDTQLITKVGISAISEVVGKQIDIWNGKNWSTVTPRVTGHNRKLYRVSFGDGSYLDATENHKFLVKHRFQSKYNEVTTSELIDLLKESKYRLSVPRANVVFPEGVGIENPYAYEYGFVLGDGTARRDHSPFAELFGEKALLPLKGKRSEIRRLEGYSVDSCLCTFIDLDNEFSYNLKTSDRLPKEIFSWDKESIILFISGWADADGSKANNGCRIYGTEGRIRDLQLLLTKVGIVSSVNLMARKGDQTNIGTRNQDVWYAQIPDASDLRINRFTVEKPLRATNKGKYQTVVDIKELPGLHTTYCFDEPELHQGLFNNVLTKQCNLSEQNASKWKSSEDVYRSAKYASILGTLQAGYTKPGYLTDVSRQIIEREALLGVSMTGMMDSPKIALDPDILRKAASIVVDTNKIWAKKLGINQAARTTCVKPAGNSSVILSEEFAVASGIHPHHSRRMIRRVQSHKDDPVLQFFKEHNPHMVEESVHSANKTDEVINFPIEVSPEAIVKEDMTAVQFLETVKLVQQSWVVSGTALPFSCEKLHHNVSNTCVVGPTEWSDVGRFIYQNKEYFSGLSLLSKSGDFKYPQAPMQRIVFESELVDLFGDSNVGAAQHVCRHIHRRYNSLQDLIVPLGMVLDGYRTEDAVKGTFIHPELLWDTYKTIRLMIHINNTDDILLLLSSVWQDHNSLWSSLVGSMKKVDYNLLLEGQDNTKAQDTIACAGGQCELDFKVG